MAERVGDVADGRHRSELAGDLAADQQVAHVRLARGQERVGLHVPRARPRAGPTCEPGDELVPPIGAHLEVVLEHDRLTVEHEAETRVGREQIEHPSTASTSRPRNTSNDRYHSRSQWKWETSRISGVNASHRDDVVAEAVERRRSCRAGARRR